MVGLGPHQLESMGSQRQDHFCDLELKRDREGNVHTTHTSKSQSRGKSHVSHEENARNMQKEIDHLKRSLHHEQQKQAPSNLDFSSRGEEDDSYRHDRELHLVSHSRMMRIIIISVGIESHLRSAWEMML